MSASPPPPPPIHANSYSPNDDVVDADVDGLLIRWWLLIDNVIYIIASTTDLAFACHGGH